LRADSKTLVLGGAGMVGAAIVKQLQQRGVEPLAPPRAELDLTVQTQVDAYFEQHKPEYVFLAAAMVGGIGRNVSQPASIGYNNIVMQSAVIEAARKHKTAKLLFLGSSCIYPKFAEQPIKEDQLLAGALEPTNEMYALAKIFGLRLCDAYRAQYGCNFISAMPSNLYGVNDTFNDEHAHVIPALMWRFHRAKINGAPAVACWGDGSPLREFLNVEDCAAACVFLMENYDAPGHVNVGAGEEVTVKDLAEMVKRVTGYKGKIVWDKSKPNGTPRKVLDSSLINSMGWRPKIKLPDGLKETYDWFTANINAVRS